MIHFSITPVFSFAGHIYPAGPVRQGSESDAIEANRTLPLMAARIHYQMTNQGKLDSYGKCVRRALKQAFILEPILEHPGCWEKSKIMISVFVNAADIALALWLVRNTVWKKL